MRPSHTFFIGSSSNSNNNIHVQRRRRNRRRIDNSIVSNTIMHPNISEIFYISWFCILLLLSCFTVFLETGSNKEEEQYDDRLQMVWAEEINGTENPDNIVGTLNQDTIRGFGENDTIDGKEAGDDISGGSGDDIIYGNEGRDVLKGKAGNDRIDGGKGNDRIFGDRGNDVLIGGPGNDTLTGGFGKDIFMCGEGKTDTVTDFNLTQKDTAPENDCENIKYSDKKNIDKNNNTIAKDNGKAKNKPFFGLFG
ncbi:MAG: calcium-binding protein [Nitrososphaeraceae archaeon]